MKFLKQNWLILIIMIVVVTMVLIRSFSSDSFRYDAVRWAASSADGSNLISADRVAEGGDQILMISLGSIDEVPAQFRERAVSIAPGELLAKDNLKMIRRNKGLVILFSGDISVSARVWMVLSEMGIENLYIFSDPVPGKS